MNLAHPSSAPTRPLPAFDRPAPSRAIEDLAAHEHRAALEEIFFHDLLNTLCSLHGYLQLWGDLSQEKARQLAPDLLRLSQRAIDEVQAQRDLVHAEAGDLRVVAQPVDVPQLLAEVCTSFQRHETDPFRIQLSVPTLDLPVTTDPVLLRRVVANLVKNALEASAPEDAVTVRWSPVARRISVHNPDVMPEEVQAQVFRRSFSTKGGGRGLGTHSIRLLAEAYLGGCVDFASAPGHGTTFRVTLPDAPPASVPRLPSARWPAQASSSSRTLRASASPENGLDSRALASSTSPLLAMASGV